MPRHVATVLHHRCPASFDAVNVPLDIRQARRLRVDLVVPPPPCVPPVSVLPSMSPDAPNVSSLLHLLQSPSTATTGLRYRCSALRMDPVGAHPKLVPPMF